MSTKNTSTTATPSPTSKISGTTGSSAYEKEEENLKRMLTLRLQRLLVRNGSDQLTYEKFVPHHLRGKGESIYRRNVKANLHEMVQRYESGGSGKRKRELFDQTAMRTAFTMKEKQHGQHALLDNSLNAFASRASRENVYNPIRRVKLEGIVEGLKIQQERLIRDYKRSLSNKTSSLHYMSKPTSAANSTELAHEVALFEEEKRKLEEERREQQKLVKRQEEKRRRAEAESRVRERERKLELARQQEMQRRLSVERSEREEAQRHVPPRQRAQLGLARLYEPIFKALWDMEFPSLNGKPFFQKSYTWIFFRFRFHYLILYDI